MGEVSVREKLKRSASLVGAVQAGRAFIHSSVRVVSVLLWRNARRGYIRKYMQNPVRKLHVGAGPAWLPGWLNTDYSPSSRDVIYLDATEPFPFPDSSFHYVFSEHMIEHIPYAKGEFFIRECNRILCPSGKVRISTPDLDRIVALYCRPERDEHSRYIKWALDFNSLPQRARPECFVLNNFLRSWGHQFIYDKETLRALLEQSGFREVTEALPGQSACIHLANLEQHDQAIGEEFNRFETMILEATKPSQGCAALEA